MRGKENAAASTNVRSPIRTRSFTTKNKITIDAKKNGLPNPKRTTKKPNPVKPIEEKQSVKQKKVDKAEKKSDKKAVPRVAKFDLDSDALELVFMHVGVYDVMTNLRRVCKRWNKLAQKESLVNYFMNSNNWDKDFVLCKKRKEHKTKYEHCLQRATVRKFYEKVKALFKKVLPIPDCDYEVPPTRETILEYWDEMSDTFNTDDFEEVPEEVTFTMPWQYMEFMFVFNGVALTSDQYGLNIPRKCGYPLYNGDESEIIESINRTEDSPDCWAWLVSAVSENSHFALLLNCDKNHPDFGIVSRYYLNIGSGENDTLPSFLDFVRGMYFRIVDTMKKFKLSEDQITRLIKSGINEEDFINPHAIQVEEDGKLVVEVRWSQEELEEALSDEHYEEDQE